MKTNTEITFILLALAILRHMWLSFTNIPQRQQGGRARCPAPTVTANIFLSPGGIVATLVEV